MQERMVPSRCPVCGNTALLIFNRRAVGESPDWRDAVDGVMRYKCENGA